MKRVLFIELSNISVGNELSNLSLIFLKPVPESKFRIVRVKRLLILYLCEKEAFGFLTIMP